MLTDKQKRDLSIPAKMSLKVIDDYIDIMNEKGIGIRASELQLYCERWMELETSIQRVSKGKRSLKNDDYRGVRIVSWEGDA